MPATMAKKKPKQDEAPVTPPPEQPTEEQPGRAADRHRHAIMSFRPPDDLRQAVVDLAVAERRSVAQVVQILVEEAMQARGLWEPPAGEEGGA